MLNTNDNFVKLSQKMKELLSEYHSIWEDFEKKYLDKTFPIANDEHSKSASNESTPKSKNSE